MTRLPVLCLLLLAVLVLSIDVVVVAKIRAKKRAISMTFTT